jgi:uncharacterized protein (TIGR00730 family)
MGAIRAVTVYCSSSSKVARVHNETAEALGREIARCGWTLVYGGNYLGVMAALVDGARAERGRVVGITPQCLADRGLSDPRCQELIVADDLRHRKRLMEERGDAFVALPGGLGTLEEIFEIIVARVLHLHDKPIVLLNVDGYYDPLLAMLEHGIRQGFIKARARDAWYVATNAAMTMRYLRACSEKAPAQRA